MEERRKYPRYKLSHKVVYNRVSKTSGTESDGSAQTEDVSRGGMKIRVNDLIGKEGILNLKIYIPSYKDPIDAEAKVVWQKETPDNSIMLGVAFTRIGWTESDKLFGVGSKTFFKSTAKAA